MKKLFCLTILSLTFGQVVYAADCLSKIAVQDKWNPLSEKQIECMKGSSELEATIQVLCSADGSEISDHYFKFLSYRDQIALAFAKFQAATNPGDRTLASLELQDLKRAQSNYGISFGIYDALDTINHIKYNCVQ